MALGAHFKLTPVPFSRTFCRSARLRYHSESGPSVHRAGSPLVPDRSLGGFLSKAPSAAALFATIEEDLALVCADHDDSNIGKLFPDQVGCLRPGRVGQIEVEQNDVR